MSTAKKTKEKKVIFLSRLRISFTGTSFKSVYVPRKASLPSLLVNIFSNSFPLLKSSVDSTTHNMVFVTVISTIPPTHLRINAHRYLLYKIRILVFQAMSTIFTGLFSRGSVGIVGFHICLSSSFTIFRFWEGENLFNVTNYLRFKDKMNSFSVGCPAGWICFSPFCHFSSYVSV